MSRWTAFRSIVFARLREFWRQPTALFWGYGFPLLLAIGLGIAFSNRPPDTIQVDVVANSGAESLAETLRQAGVLVEVYPEAECRHRYVTGKTVLYVAAAGNELAFGIDPTRSESQSARHQVESAVRAGRHPSDLKIDLLTVDEPGNRYIDFLMPGLIGMNLMGGGLFGVGFVIVELRVRKLMKRFLATPLRRSDFLLAFLTARLCMLIPEMLTLLLASRFIFGVPIRGSVVLVLTIIMFGACAFSGLGLLIGSRTEKLETVAGLTNLLMLPMWLAGGIFFSAKRFPDFIQPVIQALPITQVNEGLRDVMLEGKSFSDVWWRLAILAAYAVASFLLALKLFKWK